MLVKEAYTHTRNYGCRIRKYTCNDIRMVSIENKYLKAAFALDKGADLVELLYKPKDIDCMWHSFNAVSYTHLDVYKRQFFTLYNIKKQVFRLAFFHLLTAQICQEAANRYDD